LLSYSARLDSASAPPWKASPGDKIIGSVIDRDTYEGDFGETAVLTIQVSDPASTLDGQPLETGDEYRVFGYGTVLSRDIAKYDPQIGDLVGIKFVGNAEKSRPGQQPAKIYRFRVFERVGAVASAALAEPEQPAADSSDEAANASTISGGASGGGEEVPF
jgi:hypothetical protein